MVKRLTSQHITFPRGEMLQRTMNLFDCQGLPGCAGAIDGCLIPISKPDSNAGHLYYCYKKFYAILLLATCDSEGAFTFIDVGHPGETS